MTNETFDPNSMWGERETAGPDPDDVQPITKSFMRILIAAGVLLAISGVAIVLTFNGSDGPDVSQQNNGSAVQAVSANGEPLTKKEKFLDAAVQIIQPNRKASSEDDWQAKEKAALNRAALTEFRGQLDSLAKLKQSTDETALVLRSEFNALETSEPGAKIASDIELVDQYVALLEEFNKVGMSGSEVESYLSQLLPFIQEVEDSQDNNYRPQDYTKQQVEKLSSALAQKNKSLSRLRSSLTSLIAAADTLSPAKPLKLTIAEVEKGRIDSTARRLAKAKRTAKERETTRLEQEIDKSETDLAESKAKLVLEKNRALTVGNQLTAGKIREEANAGVVKERNAAARAKLEAEFQADLANINTYLQPFTYEARSIRGNQGGKGPASYSALLSSGALADTNQGIYQFYRAASIFDDRPISGYGGMHSIYDLTGGRAPESLRFTETGQKLLRKYGKLMIEKGMLSP